MAAENVVGSIIILIILVAAGHDGGVGQVQVVQVEHLVAHHQDVVAVDGTGDGERHHVDQVVLAYCNLKTRCIGTRRSSDVVACLRILANDAHSNIFPNIGCTISIKAGSRH